MKKVVDITTYRVIKPKDNSTNLLYSPHMIEDGFYRKYEYHDKSYDWYSVRPILTSVEDSIERKDLIKELDEMVLALEKEIQELDNKKHNEQLDNYIKQLNSTPMNIRNYGITPYDVNVVTNTSHHKKDN